MRKEGVVLRLGIVVTAILLVANAITRFVDYRMDVRDPDHLTLDIVKILDINSEANVPTWWNSGLLLTAALLAVLLSYLWHRPGLLVLAAVLGGLSLDEVAGFHERLKAAGDAVGGNALHFTWVIPGVAIAVAALVVLGRALRDVPRSLRRGLALGAGLYLLGSVGMETAGGAVLERAGDGRVYLLTSTMEEGAEMVAATYFVYTLLVALDLARLVRGYAAAGSLHVPAGDDRDEGREQDRIIA